MNSVELNKKFWKSVTPKSLVHLSDMAALEASQAEGRGLNGMDYSIKEILSVVEKDQLCEWLVFKLFNPSQTLYLVVKCVGDDVDLRMFYNPESIVVGNRQDQINNQNVFMFENYKPHSHNNLLGLKYTSQINWTFDYGNGPEEVVFNQKGNMELTGDASYSPARNRNDQYVATISEYLAEKETPEPEIMIIEVGSAVNKKGGSILLLVGNPINEFEISIVRK